MYVGVGHRHDGPELDTHNLFENGFPTPFR